MMKKNAVRPFIRPSVTMTRDTGAGRLLYVTKEQKRKRIKEVGKRQAKLNLLKYILNLLVLYLITLKINN